MSLFVDQMLIQLATPATLVDVIAPPGDPTQARPRALLTAVYDFSFAVVQDVLDVQVRSIERGRPLFPPRRTRGTWTQTLPGYTRTDLDEEELRLTEPAWVDLSVEVGMTLVLEVDPGEVETVLLSRIEQFNTLAEFRAHFQYIDLDAFMAQHGIDDVTELRERFQYLLAEIRLRAPGPFDPNDAANQRRYTLNLAVLIRDTIDVAAALRDAKLARTILERGQAFQQQTAEAEVRTPYAPVLVFPEDALAGLPFDEATLQAFFGAEGILVLFLAPP